VQQHRTPVTLLTVGTQQALNLHFLGSMGKAKRAGWSRKRGYGLLVGGWQRKDRAQERSRKYNTGTGYSKDHEVRCLSVMKHRWS